MIQHGGRCRKSYSDVIPAIKNYVPAELNNNCPHCGTLGEYKNKNKFGMTRMACRECGKKWIL